ncbi:pseudouridine synthase family protein [Mesomycoplasma ovipneumoniae]|uniref:pseudouridine synthase family protein n=1 Tax=Mesomycoplasma ovipneumoniae TaxID=29562 RepID=UPI0028A8DDD0|nr:RluA family pseudouridine synthase [Mesomycoplasma ovipneumoniae]MDW2933552.1 RluA family pseudouridine synthase [Mesomycoplasma ovipneumoniae]WNM15811.1 RluA family pseudouridine synthase [Mesomycoplasma ovipneumoniae]
MIEFSVSENQVGQKLIQLVKKLLLNFNYNEIQKLFRNKKIKVNNKAESQKYLLALGDRVLIFNSKKEVQNQKKLPKIKVNLKIIYQDSNVLIVKKPKDLQVHGGDRNLDLAVWNYLKLEKTDVFMPSHVGRLDKKTSGIILYGLNYKSVVELNKKQKFFEKIYTFESKIKLKKPIKTDLFIRKNDLNKKMEVCKNEAGCQLISTTFFSKNNRNFAILHTGKKHQIRVTLSHLGFPIFGDEKYNGEPKNRLFLHSFSLKFNNLDGFLSYLNGKKFVSKPEWWKP